MYTRGMKSVGKTHLANGFTIVELLIVVVVIAILAAITIVSYNGITRQAAETKRNTDTATLLKAIEAARTNTGKSLGQITGSFWSSGTCSVTGSNPDGTEPRNLPTTHACWTRYYSNLSSIGAAAGIDLSGLRSGDSRGNPYVFDENEGESGNFCSADSPIQYFTGNGSSTASARAIPKAFSC